MATIAVARAATAVDPGAGHSLQPGHMDEAIRVVTGDNRLGQRIAVLSSLAPSERVRCVLVPWHPRLAAPESELPPLHRLKQSLGAFGEGTHEL